MFDVIAQLVNDQEEIHGLDQIQWEKDSWKRLSLIGDETVINFQSTKVYVFSDSVLCFGRDPSTSGFQRKLVQSGGSTLQLCGKINDLLSDLGQTPETFTRRINLCRCSLTSLVTEEKAIKKNV